MYLRFSALKSSSVFGLVLACGMVAAALLIAQPLAAQGPEAQTTATATTSSDSQALSLAAQSVQALTRGATVSDVTLTGTATQTAGSWSSTGQATFKALGTAKRRLDFAASGPSEVRTLDTSGSPTGAWTKADRVKHTIALHNSFSDAAWFFPALTSLSAASQAGVVAKYIGSETHNRIAVQHLRLWHTADSILAAIANVIPRLSTVDFYLDASTSLPVALAFNAHSDNDMNTNITIEVRYADDRAVSGVTVRFLVQKYLSNGLVMDFVASTVAINSGLTDAQFN